MGVSHIRRRRPQVGRASSVGKVLLPSRGHGWLPMGHCGQVMVHIHRRPGTVGSRLGDIQPRVASMGAIRATKRTESGTENVAPFYAAISNLEARISRAADGWIRMMSLYRLKGMH